MAGYFRIMSDLQGLKWRVAVKGVLTGFVSGLLVILYRIGNDYGNETSLKVFSYIREHPEAAAVWVIAAVGAGLILAWLIRREPMATGSGIPQVEGQLLAGMKMKWPSILAVRLLGGTLASFFGLSLGREGPSVQIGASGSQALAKKLSSNKLEKNYLITGGAAAGLSAAFNAPLSGIMFALEEVHRSFSPAVLIAATTASLTADIVSKYVFGLKPVLNFTATPQLPVSLYLWLIPLGLLSGLAGAAMNGVLLSFQKLYDKMPAWLRPVLALLMVLPCGLLLPQVLGGGQGLIEFAELGDGNLLFLLLLLAVKMLFTGSSFGSGIPGGIFMPILSVGALSGGALGLVAEHFGMPAQYVADFAVCAMAGALAGSVRAPVTSILLTAEMTGTLIHLLPVAACSFLAMILCDMMKVEPIYEALLDRIQEKSGISSETKAGSLIEIPVELGSEVAGKTIGEVDWPEGMLVVGIHRGNKEFVPNGGTKILPGDYLVVLSSEGCYREMSECLRARCLHRHGE
jgi:H+/Cl- antiporter ClcA